MGLLLFSFSYDFEKNYVFIIKIESGVQVAIAVPVHDSM